ncbi:MAG TPA: anti-sigma factor [Streptosporangiaceae bacterium]|jgi:anti-sigma-K factor RskA
MRTRRPEPHTLSGAYALDALTGADLVRFERHLARCEQCEREIAGLRETAARLGAAAPADPPARLAEQVFAATARTRQLPPASRDRAAPRLPLLARLPRYAGAARSPGPGPDGSPRGGHAGRGGRGRAWPPRLALALGAAGLILAGILGVSARSAEHQLAGDQQRSHTIAAILTAPDATILTARVSDGGTATVVMSGHEHALVFVADGLRPLPASRRYELWLLGPRGDKSAGMLPGASSGMTGPALASGVRTGERIGLSVEPAAGSPHPTSAMLLVLAL